MLNLVFYVFSKNKDFSLEIKNDSEEALLRYIELISIFWNVSDNKIEIQPMIQMNDDIKNKYTIFVDKYKIKEPKLNRLKSSLDKIPNNEYFFAINKANHTAEEILFIGNLVNTYNSTSDDKKRAELFQNQITREKELFGDLLSKYKVSVFDSAQKYFIGEHNRQKRICRFCTNGMNTKKKVTFNLKAHAISEALGNKSIILNEECDTCNATFGSSIENDFIQYLDIHRVFFKVKGKNGIPKIKFDNDAIITHITKENIPKNDLINNTENLMVVVSKDITHNKETGELSVLLKSKHKLKEINIYKTLCKYTLSTIDTSELEYLKNTIKWVNEESVEQKLPKVATVIINEMYVDTPCLNIYIRKDNDYTHPHVVSEFKFKSLIFIFILPFSSKDKIDFTKEESYNIFWKTFKHYDSIKNWLFNDFSSINSKKYQFNMKMSNQNTNKS